MNVDLFLIFSRLGSFNFSSLLSASSWLLLFHPSTKVWFCCFIRQLNINHIWHKIILTHWVKDYVEAVILDSEIGLLCEIDKCKIYWYRSQHASPTVECCCFKSIFFILFCFDFFLGRKNLICCRFSVSFFRCEKNFTFLVLIYRDFYSCVQLLTLVIINIDFFPRSSS